MIVMDDITIVMDRWTTDFLGGHHDSTYPVTLI